MSSNKKFSECEYVDSFFINLNLSGATSVTLPYSTNFTLPVLLNAQIQYIKVKCMNLTLSAAATNAGVNIIKCDALASCDKILYTFNANSDVAANNETYNTDSDMLLRVITPFVGQLGLHLTCVAVPAATFDGLISIGIECYA